MSASTAPSSTEPREAPPSWSARWTTAAPFALALATVAVYVASLRGGFLNYDDDWLIQNNPILARHDAAGLAAIWTDLSEPTRMKLGAEWLPLRDTLEWIEACVYGLDPHAMRAMSLALYVGGVLFVRAWLVRAIGGLTAEIAAWTFALHPAHVESVAWLAGQKDVLALFFVAAAMHVYAGASKRRAWAVPLLMGAACLSKGVAVTAPLLLPVHSFLARRRVDRVPFALSLAAALAVLAMHMRVGAIVQMTTPALGGSRVAAAATMGPVLGRYLAHVFFPAGLSVVYEVDPATPGALVAWLAYAPLVAWAAFAIRAMRRDDRVPAASLAIFAITMAPTSQILVSLQNVMADRYLLLPLLGPCLLAGSLAARAVAWKRAALAPAVGAIAALGVAAAVRAEVFTSSESLWRDATAKTRVDPKPPYQLAMALEPSDLEGAEAAYREALRRSGGDYARAIPNLAIVLVKMGRSSDAIALLAEAVPRYPDDPKMLGNLAELVARSGDEARARALFGELLLRFPSYEVGRRNFEKHFGRSADPKP